MQVDRCVCGDVTFIELKRYADEHRCGFDELRQRFGCGRGCGLCEPYVRAMLKTGQMSFASAPPLPPPDQTADL